MKKLANDLADKNLTDQAVEPKKTNRHRTNAANSLEMQLFFETNIL